ncbi:MAG: PhzF family phenazine biosynthesis protein [Alphaproteobacteria bacterium]|nr:PhzF family phenazine biosynthesis protein [Alphaproteobacteria bacterium]
MPSAFLGANSGVQAMRYAILDVFTRRAFGGNPLAVFEGGEGLSAAAMQTIAGEWNLSESVFLRNGDGDDNGGGVVVNDKGDGNIDGDGGAVIVSDDVINKTGDGRGRKNKTTAMRIFTPRVELPFAGHPVIGTAAWLSLNGAGEEFSLKTRAGNITVSTNREGKGEHECVCVSFIAPLTPKRHEDAEHGVTETAVANLVGLNEEDIDRRHAGAIFAAGGSFYFLPVKPKALSRARVPDVAALTQLWNDKTKRPSGVYVFSLSDIDTAAVRARMFAPEVGIPEDPATGSAAVALAGWLSLHGLTTDAKKEFVIEQGKDMGRPSQIRMSRDGGRVRIGGCAVLAATGEVRAEALASLRD